MKKFQPGKTYTFTFIGDSDSCVPCKVISRTEKTVTIQVRSDEPVRKKIHVHDDVEHCYPTGNYSMCPMLGADREEKPEAPERIYISHIAGDWEFSNATDKDGVRYIQSSSINKKLSKLLREMLNKDMAGGYWYNELHRIMEEGK